jgi:hypothetical protein
MVMIYWDKFIKLVQDRQIHLDLYKRYMDYINAGIKMLVYLVVRLTFEESYATDKALERYIRQLANTVMSGIIHMEDIPSNHFNENIPVLNLQCWVVKYSNMVLHGKEVGNTAIINSCRSALTKTYKEFVLVS